MNFAQEILRIAVELDETLEQAAHKREHVVDALNTLKTFHAAFDPDGPITQIILNIHESLKESKLLDDPAFEKLFNKMIREPLEKAGKNALELSERLEKALKDE